MRGYVVKKGNNWYAVVYDGINPATGKERRRWVAAGPKKGDADKIVNDMVKRRDGGEAVVGERITLGDYLLERWLPVQENRLRRTTFDQYRRNFVLHVIPALGKRQIDKLTPDDLDVLYAKLLKEGNKGRRGGGLSVKTVRKIHLALHKALADATRKGVTIRNVAALADPPTTNSKKSTEIKAWDAEQLLAFLTAIASHRFAPLFDLAANTGMRRGELLGLRWRDIDFGAKLLSVRQALVSVAYAVELSDVKTDHGRRTIDLDPDTVAMLERWRDVRLAEQGGRLDADGLVFVKPDGTSPHPDIVSQIFDRKVAKLDVPKITLHDLRHTHATLLLKAGVPVKVVSERLGHSTPAFTMSVYQHVLPGMQAEAAATFARLLGKSPATSAPSNGLGSHRRGTRRTDGHHAPRRQRGAHR